MGGIDKKNYQAPNPWAKLYVKKAQARFKASQVDPKAKARDVASALKSLEKVTTFSKGLESDLLQATQRLTIWHRGQALFQVRSLINNLPRNWDLNFDKKPQQVAQQSEFPVETKVAAVPIKPEPEVVPEPPAAAEVITYFTMEERMIFDAQEAPAPVVVAPVLTAKTQHEADMEAIRSLAQEPQQQESNTTPEIHVVLNPQTTEIKADSPLVGEASLDVTRLPLTERKIAEGLPERRLGKPIADVKKSVVRFDVAPTPAPVAPVLVSPTPVVVAAPVQASINGDALVQDPHPPQRAYQSRILLKANKTIPSVVISEAESLGYIVPTSAEPLGETDELGIPLRVLERERAAAKEKKLTALREAEAVRMKWIKGDNNDANDESVNQSTDEVILRDFIEQAKADLRYYHELIKEENFQKWLNAKPELRQGWEAAFPQEASDTSGPLSMK